MYFTKIRLIGLHTIDLPIVGALPTDPYILKNADGLGPPDVDLSIGRPLNQSGYYQGRRPQPRYPVFRVGLNPNYSVGETPSDLRTKMYGLLTPGYDDVVHIQLMNKDTVVAVTKGQVSKLETVPFSKDPEVQITFECYNPYLEAPSVTNAPLASLSKSELQITNTGNAPTGFHMELTFTEAQPVWLISDVLVTKVMVILYDFLVGDKLILDTNPGSREISRVRGGVKASVLSGLQPDATWHMLHGGVNTFGLSPDTFNWNSFYFTPQYWGI